MPLSDLDSRAARGEDKVSTVKLHAVQYVIALIVLILMTGLWRLQVLGASNYRVLAEANRVRKVPILAPRGKIFDREGRLLVDNYSSVAAYLLREQMQNPETDLPMISVGLNIPIEQLQYTLRKYKLAPKYQPIPLKQDITPDEQAFIEAHRNELPELETIEEQRRLYPRDGFASHLIGYVGEVSEQMLNQERYALYSPGDVVGKSGVEQSYDALLRGVDGSRDVIVNSHGRELGRLGEELAKPGQDIRLTIDLDLQMAAEKALEGKNGAIVAMDPHTGEILAMVSRPNFDPNQFAVRLTRNYWNQLLTDPEHPLLNKAIQAQLAPGSTFKIIMSVAGLEEGTAQDLKVNCTGGADFYGHFFKCDARHGGVNIYNAIPLSCDIFYYTLAQKLGIDTIAKYATELGLSQRTGIDLPEEASGTMPSTKWKMKNFHDKWYAGETISVGIGQGAVAATPIQMARALSGVASGGALVRPHVLSMDQIPESMRQAYVEAFPGSGEKKVSMRAENWQIISDAMAETMNTGTASLAHLDGVDFAGKTGTAQVMSHDALARSGGGKKTQPNAWFVGMVPRRNPDIVVAALIENGEWGKYSAKLAAQVITAFIDKQRKKDNNLRVAEVKPKPTEETPAKPEQKPEQAPSAAVPEKPRSISGAGN
ncbi:penicillin-binding protein 2 [Terriglobus saanensis]|uniref:Penicillin-binding protein 2 n=1 Tax=Terriglobus saanensis (strain ATCC BAA-1853 / DSM 23119 / SP1PR4) TaxID=401053 RepID=E8V7L8_TERSS|nr:penicillin-binding protein 2 [Terriglobus saanensis]ADV81716.1 penicillin-binding protein 2 [Terriglobus saanensis SP1PR4]